MKPTPQASLYSYVVGFIWSLGLTLIAYSVVVQHQLARSTVLAVIVILALVQAIIQLLYFLHLGTETKPRWKLTVFIFMVMVVVILVGGSLWIMNNLNYTMTPQQINGYLNNQGGGF